jgi:hypothetical protein
MTTNQTTVTPFAEFVAGDDSYDLSAWIHVTVNRYPGGVVAREQAVSRDYCIEAAGHTDGTWSLRVSPWNGEMEGDDVLTGPPLVELRDQTSGTDPLALLRALLSGQAR